MVPCYTSSHRPCQTSRNRNRNNYMKKAFDHIGIPTSEPQPGESWVAFSQVWVTNPRTHPQRIEYFRPKEPPQVSPSEVGLWKLCHLPHVAYRVNDMQAALQGEEVIFRP